MKCAGLLLALACTASHADNCEAIRSSIESKFRAGGVQSFALVVVDADAGVSGRKVGTCANGTRKIVYSAAPAAARPVSAGPRKADEGLLTECRDGTVSRGGDCAKRDAKPEGAGRHTP